MTREELKSIMRYYQRRRHRLRQRVCKQLDGASAYQLRKAIRRTQAQLKMIDEFFARQDGSEDGNWVTINGTHVLIDENGVAQSGGKLKGSAFKDAKSVSGKKIAASAPSIATTTGEPKKPKPSGNCHVPVSKADSRAFQKYELRNEKETSVIVETHKTTDEAIRQQYGDSQMTTLNFAQKARDAFNSWDEEDKLLDAAYTGAIGKLSFKTDYAELNRKLRKNEQLTDGEQAVVDHFSRCAKPLGKTTNLYRMVNSDYVQSILSSAGVTNLEELSGKTVTNHALQSSCVGVSTFFDTKDVAIKIKVPADMPVCLTSDVGEGEVVIPAGARMKITSARAVKKSVYQVSKERDDSGKRKVTLISEGDTEQVPVWESARLRACGQNLDPEILARDCGFADSNKASKSLSRFTHLKNYIEMEIVGYEQ